MPGWVFDFGPEAEADPDPDQLCPLEYSPPSPAAQPLLSPQLPSPPPPPPLPQLSSWPSGLGFRRFASATSAPPSAFSSPPSPAWLKRHSSPRQHSPFWKAKHGGFVPPAMPSQPRPPAELLFRAAIRFGFSPETPCREATSLRGIVQWSSCDKFGRSLF